IVLRNGEIGNSYRPIKNLRLILAGAPTLSPAQARADAQIPRGQRMTTIDRPFTENGTSTSILDRERIIATAGFNRWLVPPAALCIHLCIGMAYGFSVFWLPLSRAIGLIAPKAVLDSV